MLSLQEARELSVAQAHVTKLEDEIRAAAIRGEWQIRVLWKPGPGARKVMAARGFRIQDTEEESNIFHGGVGDDDKETIKTKVVRISWNP